MITNNFSSLILLTEIRLSSDKVTRGLSRLEISAKTSSYILLEYLTCDLGSSCGRKTFRLFGAMRLKICLSLWSRIKNLELFDVNKTHLRMESSILN